METDDIAEAAALLTNAAVRNITMAYMKQADVKTMVLSSNPALGSILGSRLSVEQSIFRRGFYGEVYDAKQSS